MILVARRQKQLEEVADRCRERLELFLFFTLSFGSFFFCSLIFLFRGGGGKIHVLAVDLSTKEVY